jgi:hypothetical protein
MPRPTSKKNRSFYPNCPRARRNRIGSLSAPAARARREPALLARLKSAFACVHDRAQNAAMNRLFDLKREGALRAFVLPYLGQDDSRMKFRPADLVTREEAYAYPTDFFAMKPEWIDRLSRRGERLTKALIAEHAPELIPRHAGAA